MGVGHAWINNVNTFLVNRTESAESASFEGAIDLKEESMVVEMEI